MTQQNRTRGRPPKEAATGHELQRLSQYAEVFALSRYFKLDPAKSGGIEQGLVILLAGEAMGLTPFQAMQSVHIIEGRPTLAANAYASALRAHPHYDYQVIGMGMSECAVRFLDNRRKDPVLGEIRITLADAERLGWTVGSKGRKKNWDHHPDAMLFARCISRGARYYCPDLFGFSAYVPDEMEDAEPEVEAEVVSVRTPSPGNPGKLDPEALRESRERERMREEGIDPDAQLDPEWEALVNPDGGE